MTFKKLTGFTLIEMAVVIAIMGILMTFGIKLATNFQNKASFSATADRQNQIKETLIAYLGRNGRLPCPADPIAMTGVASPESGVCTNLRGLIPYQTLGIPRNTAVDGWDRFFTYSVWNNADSSICDAVSVFPLVPVTSRQDWTSVLQYSPAIPPGHTFHDGGEGCIKVEDVNSNNILQGRRAVVVIVSHGPNGYGGYNSKGQFVSSAEATVEEAINFISGTDHTFHTRPINLGGFDDIVMDLNANLLLNPLKRDGTILSINQLERAYRDTLYSGFVITPTGTPPSMTCSILSSNPTFTVVINSATSATISRTNPNIEMTISSNQYCPGGSFI